MRTLTPFSCAGRRHVPDIAMVNEAISGTRPPRRLSCPLQPGLVAVRVDLLGDDEAVLRLDAGGASALQHDQPGLALVQRGGKLLEDVVVLHATLDGRRRRSPHRQPSPCPGRSPAGSRPPPRALDPSRHHAVWTPGLSSTLTSPSAPRSPRRRTRGQHRRRSTRPSRPRSRPRRPEHYDPARTINVSLSLIPLPFLSAFDHANVRS